MGFIGFLLGVLVASWVYPEASLWPAVLGGIVLFILSARESGAQSLREREAANERYRLRKAERLAMEQARAAFQERLRQERIQFKVDNPTADWHARALFRLEQRQQRLPR